MKTADSSRLGRFTCNVCGWENDSPAGAEDREKATCAECQSSIRFRAIILALSRAVFGADLALTEFPVLKSVRGLGISDSDNYAGGLERCFNYTNTYFHREPRFDLSKPDEGEFGRYDFVICSEVLEHVAPPVERAFETLARLLKPCGALILTVPYTLDPSTIEHFPELREAGLAEVNGRTVLVNRLGDHEYQVYDRLAFHGGDGSTLEMRIFSEAALQALLSGAGLPEVRLESSGSRKFGVAYSGPCSLPIVAGRAPFSLPAAGVAELIESWTARERLLERVRTSRWVRLGRRLGLGPELRKR